MSQRNTRVAIIGAGIIGLYLAWRLAQKGCKVIVFEKEEGIENKVCSGLVSRRIHAFIPLPSSIIENKIERCVIYFSRKKAVILNLRPPHYILNRHKLNCFLFHLAQKAGAEIFFSRAIDEIPSGFDRIIGCDGASSKIRIKLGLPSPHFKLGMQIFISRCERRDQVEVFPTAKGFFWRIPRGERIEFGALGEPSSIREEFKFFLEKNNIVFEEKAIKLALIPQGLILPQSERITLCGDAMGLTKPWSGGGIIWGLRAGEILVKNFPNFQRYHQEVKKEFGFRIFKGKLVTSLVYFLGENFPYFLPSKVTRDNDFPLL